MELDAEEQGKLGCCQGLHQQNPFEEGRRRTSAPTNKVIFNLKIVLCYKPKTIIGGFMYVYYIYSGMYLSINIWIQGEDSG